MATPNISLIGRDAANIVRKLANQVRVQIVQGASHLVGMLLVHTKNDGLGEAVALGKKSSQMMGDSLGSGSKSDDAFEVLGLILVVGNLAAETVEITLAGAPPSGIPTADDAVDSIRSEETVLDPLSKTVLVERIPKIAIGIAIVLAQRRCGHAQLVGRCEVLQDLAPVAFIAGAAAVALVHDDEVEEIRRIRLVKPGPALVFRNGLVDGEVHFTALVRLAVLDLPTGIAKGSEDLILGIVNQDVAVGQVENPGTPVFAETVPAAIPKLPADLKCNHGLAGAGRHGQQHPSIPLKDGLHRSIDGDFLVIAWALAGEVVERAQQLFGCSVIPNALRASQTAPKIVRRRKRIEFRLNSGQKVELDNAVTIGGVGKMEAKHQGIVLGLLKSVSWVVVSRFCLKNRKGKISLVAEQVVRTLLRTSPGLGT